MDTYPAITFRNTRSAYDAGVNTLSSDDACLLDHGDIEALAEARGREFTRSLIQDHFDLRSERERASVRRK